MTILEQPSAQPAGLRPAPSPAPAPERISTRFRIRRFAYEPPAPSTNEPPQARTDDSAAEPVSYPVPPAELIDTEAALQFRETATRMLRMAFEVIDRRRPIAALGTTATPPVLRYLCAAVLDQQPTRPTRLHSAIHASFPTAQAAEVTAVAVIAGRIRAIAVRFDRHRGTWRATALRILRPRTR